MWRTWQRYVQKSVQVTIDVDEVEIFYPACGPICLPRYEFERNDSSARKARHDDSCPGHCFRRSKADPSTLLRTQKDPFTPSHALLPDTDHKVVVDPVTVLLHMAIPTRSTLISTVI